MSDGEADLSLAALIGGHRSKKQSVPQATTAHARRGRYLPVVPQKSMPPNNDAPRRPQGPLRSGRDR